MEKQITLATLPQATAQEVFDQVARHLLQQGKKSGHAISGGPLAFYCSYREGNLKCAAGCLIGDEEYSMDMENSVWSTLVIEGRVPDTHARLIGRLQVVHDQHNPDQWQRGLRAVAREFDLDESVVLDYVQ